MLKALLPRLFGRHADSPPPVTERSSFAEVTRLHPHAPEFLAAKYRVRPTEKETALPLVKLVKRYGLPPAQILYMEIQMAKRAPSVPAIPAPEVKRLLERDPGVRLLDAREGWEIELCRIPGSRVLSRELLDEIVSAWPKDTPIVVYCHHGVRSFDAASYLGDQGFTAVSTLEGGIEAWSVQIDPAVRRYEGNWC